jgi:hypothetical protein
VGADVAILSTTAVALAVWVETNSVDGTEMTLDASELFFKDQVEEAGVELADPRRRRCHLHGLLTTTKYNLREMVDK